MGALTVLLIGRWLAGWLRRALGSSLKRADVDKTLAPFVTALAFYLALVFILIAALGIVGIPIASFVALLGAAGLAIGLAFRDTLSNFAAGAMLLSFRPFEVGHWVEVASVAGTVERIGIFSAILRRGDNVMVSVPNSQIWASTIVNYNDCETRRIDLVIGIDYGDDIGRAIEIIRRVLSEDSRVLEGPEPIVGVKELGQSSVDLIVWPWCARKDYSGLRRDLLRAIKEQLEAGGCSLPFPQRTVHLVGSSASLPVA